MPNGQKTGTAQYQWSINLIFLILTIVYDPSLSLLSLSSVTSTQSGSITASYAYNGSTKTGNKQVTIEGPDDQPPGGVPLLEETFDNAGLDQRGWYGAGATNSSVVFDADRQSNVLESVYSTGATIPISGSLRHLFTESKNIYVRYYVRYSSNWQWAGESFGPHEWYLLTNADHQWKRPAHSRLTFYIEANKGTPLTGIQDAENVDSQNIGVDLTGVTEDRAAAGCNGSTDGYPGYCYASKGLWFNGKQWRAPPATGSFQNNVWHRVEVYIELNSITNQIGESNGVIKYWLDGNLILSLNNVLIRTGAQPNLKFNQIMFGPYFSPGAPNQQSFRIDDLLVMDNAARIDTNPPAAPTNLRLQVH